MIYFFLKDVLNNDFGWLAGKKIIAYFLVQGDVIILLLLGILILTWKRWNRIKDR